MGWEGLRGSKRRSRGLGGSRRFEKKKTSLHHPSVQIYPHIHDINLSYIKLPFISFLDEFQCSQCLKYFFSMELLRNHQHVHVNRYKCTMCDMTTSSPSGLVQHVRYRHLKSKPFECSQCDYRWVLIWFHSAKGP